MGKNNLSLVIKGFLMGTADVIPGISGGTVAFLTGIYEELVKTIAGFNPANLIKIFKESDRSKLINNYWTSLNISFILFILAGIVPAIFLAALWIPFTVDQFPHFFFAFCLGCIVFTLVKPFQEQDWKPVTFIFLLLGILSMAALLLSPKNEINLKLTDSKSNLVYEGKFQNSSRLKLSLSNTILGDQHLNLSINETSFVINMEAFNENKVIRLASDLVVQKKKTKNDYLPGSNKRAWCPRTFYFWSYRNMRDDSARHQWSLYFDTIGYVHPSTSCLKKT